MKAYHSYENYSATSKNYDKSRVPIGVSLILEYVKKNCIPIPQLLDAGCGTGSYLVALRDHFSRIDGLEFNPGMLEQARQKTSPYTNIFLHQGSVLSMPFANSSFDVAIFNQVIHHLDEDVFPGKPTWANLRKTLAESRRVLRSGGHLILNTCGLEQVFDGFWYTSLIPHAVKKLARRYVPIEDLKNILITCGFEIREVIVPVNETFSGIRNLHGFLNPRGPLRKDWRDGDSIWSLATKVELENAKKFLRDLLKNGAAKAFVDERDKIRQKIGQATFVIARRET